MTPIDAFVSMSHYEAHIRPIIHALPLERRGHVYAPDRRDQATGLPMHDLIPGVIIGRPPQSDAPVLVGGFQDHMGHRPTVLVSHGAGQTYAGVDLPSYDGGPGRERVGLFLCPNEQSAERNRVRYPGAMACAVGCPKLDGWREIPPPGDGTIAVSFHWPAYLHVQRRDASREMVPEGGTAFQDWRDQITQLAQKRPVIGHGHPRARQTLADFWASIGVEAVWDPVEVLRRADVLVIDNSSYGFEWAACGRPVVWLNGADWRPEVEHGLRFWSQVPGPQVWPVEGLSGLLSAIEEAQGRDWRVNRGVISRQVYGPQDGRASERAAEAVLCWEREGSPHRPAYGRPGPCRNC